MSSRTGWKRTDGQRLSPLLGALCGPSTMTLTFAARHPAPIVRRALDTTFGLVSRVPGLDVAMRALQVDGAAGRIDARLYEPSGAGPDAGLLVFFHGGGFAVGSLDSHANVARFTAAHAGCRVLAVGYRKAPEHPFPAAFEDCRAAFRWAVAHAAELGTDPERIAVGGDSAGAQLAAAVALHLDDGEQAPCFAWLIYPVVDADVAGYRSAQLFALGPLLSRENALALLGNYVPGRDERRDPRMTLVGHDALHRMPRTYVATAGMDPLRDQGERFAELLRDAGVEVATERFENMPHGFDVLLVDAGARRATKATCEALRDGLRARRAQTV